MKQGLFTIKCNRQVADKVYLMRLQGDASAFTRAGQFADIALEGRFLRRPFAATEWDDEGFSLLYKVVGEGTDQMKDLREGTVLDVLTGLGNGFDPSICRKSALIVCGGLGASPAFSLARQLVANGKKVSVILGFNCASEAVLAGEYESLGAEVTVATMDGSMGIKGMVTDAIDATGPEFDCFYTCGPKVMMKAVCEMLQVPGQASLEERMGCGCGICYGCTCRTAKGPRRVCADGPVFDKEDIIW